MTMHRVRTAARSGYNLGMSARESTRWGQRSALIATRAQSAYVSPRKENLQDRGKCPDTFPHVLEVLRSRVYDVVSETALDPCPNLSSRYENSIWVKREDTLPVFSFKLRGAYNKMVHLNEKQKAAGVVACNAGNHAQGVAYSGRMLGIDSKIFMPMVTPNIKIDAVRKLGVEPVVGGASFDEAYAACMECAKEEGRVLVHPFDDPLVIAGAGTVGMEIMKQTSLNPIDAVFVSVGGGGLVSGIGSFIKTLLPSVKIIGVEAEDAPGMTESLKAGRVVTLETVGSFADGAAVKKIGEKTFKICQEVVDEMVTVTTDETCAAIRDVFSEVRVILEPAGALSIAGMKKYIRSTGVKGKNFVVVASGANMDFTRLRFVSERADSKETLMSVIIPERPGSFKKLYQAIGGRFVTEFSYRYNQNNLEQAHIMLSFRVNVPEEVSLVEKSMMGEGFEVTNLTDNELAKDHGRYLVGGRSAVPDELLFRFEFPERHGALGEFLDALQSRWNISLFHYRNKGSDVARVLIGIQVPVESRGDFHAFLGGMKELGYPAVDETYNPVYSSYLVEN